MIVKYPVHTLSQNEAINIAKNMASSNGFKHSITISVQRLAETEWVITLDVQK